MPDKIKVFIPQNVDMNALMNRLQHHIRHTDDFHIVKNGWSWYVYASIALCILVLLVFVAICIYKFKVLNLITRCTKSQAPPESRESAIPQRLNCWKFQLKLHILHLFHHHHNHLTRHHLQLCHHV